MHQGRLSEQRLVELAPVVVEAAADDAVAAALLDRLADEIVAFVRATLPQIGAGDAPVEVVLGGGLLQAPNARLRDAVGERLAALDPSLRPVVPADPPIIGAALMALELAGAEGVSGGPPPRDLRACGGRPGPGPGAPSGARSGEPHPVHSAHVRVPHRLCRPRTTPGELRCRIGAWHRSDTASRLEHADDLAVLVDVDVEAGGLLAEAGHLQHVAAQRHDEARAGVGAHVAHRDAEVARAALQRSGRPTATGASSPCRP